MRILHCIPSLASGGAERQLTYLCHGLVSRGWDVHVTFMQPGPYFIPLRQAGAALHPLAIRHNYDPQLLWRIYSLVRRLMPQLVQTWIPQMDILGGACARLLGIPWILCEGSAPLAYPPSLRHFVRDRVAWGATAIVANSAGGLEYWNARVPARVPRRVIPNGLPLTEMDAFQPALVDSVALRPGQKLILCVGRLSPEKNQLAVLKALQHVQSDYLAVFCGEGHDLASLSRHVNEHGLAQRVRFLGYVPCVWGLMKSADVLVSLSLFEGQPNAVIEAMACRCPLVVSDIPAHREFLDATSALLVRSLDDRATARGIEEALAREEAVNRRVHAARSRAEMLTMERLIDGYEEMYRAVIERQT